MSAVVFDTLSYARRMENAGFSRAQAEALAEEQARLIDERLATKGDVRALAADVEAFRAALTHDIEALRVSTKADIEALRVSTKADIDALRISTKADVESLRVSTKADLETVRLSLSHEIETLRLSVRGDLEAMRANLLQSFIGVAVVNMLALLATAFAIARITAH